MDAMDAVALGARVQQVADKLLHKAQEARAKGNAAAAQSLSDSVNDLRHAAAVLVEQKRLLTVRQSTTADAPPPPSSSSGIPESGDAAPRARLRRNSSASSIVSMLSTYEVGSVYNGSVAGSVHHSHSHSQHHAQSQQQQQELVTRLTRVEKMLGKKSDEMKAKGNENASNALMQSASYVRNGSNFIAEQQRTINALSLSQEKLQVQWRALSKFLAREEDDQRAHGDDEDDGEVLPKVAAIAAELSALRGFLKTAFPECRDHSDATELVAALQNEREAAKAEAHQQLSFTIETLEAERDHLHQQLAEMKRAQAEEYLIAREDIEILKNEKAVLERQLRTVEIECAARSERELIELQLAHEAVVKKSSEEVKHLLDAKEQQLSEFMAQAESWKTQFHDEQRKLKESEAAATERRGIEMAALESELKLQKELVVALEKSVKGQSVSAGVLHSVATADSATVTPAVQSTILPSDHGDNTATVANAAVASESEMVELKKLRDDHAELQELLRDCEESLESERQRSAKLANECEALGSRVSEIERDYERELEALKSEHGSRIAEMERQYQVTDEESSKLMEKLENLESENETREQTIRELKEAVDGYREECSKARKEVDERDGVISRLQESLQSKDESIGDARSQLEAKLSALQSDVQTLCEYLERSTDASPDSAMQSLSGVELQTESKDLQDAIMLQVESHVALKEQFDKLQVDEQKLRDMASEFLISCESCFASEEDEEGGESSDIGERFNRVKVCVTKALDKIKILRKAVDEKAAAEQTLERKFEGITSEWQQKHTAATDAIQRLEQQLENVEADKAKLESELHDHKSRSIDGADREEAREKELEQLEQRLKDVEAEYERYRGRSHTALKKVEKRAELLNGMRKDNEQLKKKLEDVELECQNVRENEKNLAESLREVTQTQDMMQEEFKQREVEIAEKMVAYEAQLLKLAEAHQLAQRDLQEANEMLEKLERERMELADARNQFYEQEKEAKEAELADLTLKYHEKESEVDSLADEIQGLKKQLQANTIELDESTSKADSLGAKLRECADKISQLESELSATARRTEQTNEIEGETSKRLQEELGRLQIAFAEEKAKSERKCAEMAAQINKLKMEAKASEETIRQLSQETKEASIRAEPSAHRQAKSEQKSVEMAPAKETAAGLLRIQEEKLALEATHKEQEARIAQLVSQATGYEHRIDFLEDQIGRLQSQVDELNSNDNVFGQQQQHDDSLSSKPPQQQDGTKDETIRELRRQVLDLQDQLQHFEEEQAARDLEQERGELAEIQAARQELQKKNEHVIKIKKRKALMATFKQHLNTVVNELQRGLDEHSAAFRDACEFRDAHRKRIAALEAEAAVSAAAAAKEDDDALPAEGASTEDPVVSSVESSPSPSSDKAAADEFEEYLVMNSGVVIKAGASFKLPVFCEKKGWRVVWKFSVKEESADVGFGLTAGDDKKRNGEHKTIVFPDRVNSLSGVYNVKEENGTTLVFEWDNTFSWLNEKTLDYHVSLQEPLSPAKQQVKVQERAILSSAKELRDGLAILAEETDRRAQLKSAVEHLHESEQEKDVYLEQFTARKEDILKQKTDLQAQMEELKTALSNMVSEQDEIEDDTRTLLKAWDDAQAEREDAETTVRLAETSQLELLAAQLEEQVQTLEQSLLSFQDCLPTTT